MTYPADIRILSLDIATRCGWAVLAYSNLTSGSRSFARGPRAHIGATHAMFGNWLTEKLTAVAPTLVIYEDAGFFRSADAVQICVGLRGILLAQTAALNIPVTSYSPSEVKLFWCGSGCGDKAQMLAATRKRLPQIVAVDHNESDALALLHLHLAKMGCEELQLIT